MTLSERSYKKELLDQDDIPFDAIKRNMQELDLINTWLGGHAITNTGFKRIAGGNTDLTVCEIGCGGGDNLAALLRFSDKAGIGVKVIGIDIKKECIDFARQNRPLQNRARWIHSDYRNVTFEKKADIIFSSLFCHHFTNEELVGQVQWMRDHCTMGFFINDLQRSIIAFQAIRFLTRCLSKSYLVKHDAPLSVARALIKDEWKQIFQDAGITNFSIQWQWAFRYLITYVHE